MKKYFYIVLLSILFIACNSKNKSEDISNKVDLPNILIAISDDHSFPHTSAYGYEGVKTPNFDNIAKLGVLFNNAYVASPGCSPSRAAILTGQYPWQIEEAGTHASRFPARLQVLPDIFEQQAGYQSGFTGKGWGPGDWKGSGRKRNPAGTEYNDVLSEEEIEGISTIDYAANFNEFLNEKPKGKPFFFWYGAHEPHRDYLKGIGEKSCKNPENVKVPAFMPDVPEIRSDMMDYAFEIEWFDKHLGHMIKRLKQSGDFENTIIIVTADNGMPFPRAKANCYDFGIHVPLAIYWPAKMKAGKISTDLVSLIDIAPTLLDILGIDQADYNYSGKSLDNILFGNEPNTSDTNHAIFSSRERHSYSRHDNLGYPQRAIRVEDYLLIWNMKPDLWPAGAPQKYLKNAMPAGRQGELEEMHLGYHDIDKCPSLDFLIENWEDEAISKYFHLSVDKRPEIELFDVISDPACLNNLSADKAYFEIKEHIFNTLKDYLKKTNDARVKGNGDIWETYPRLRGPMRKFPKSMGNDN